MGGGHHLWTSLLEHVASCPGLTSGVSSSLSLSSILTDSSCETFIGESSMYGALWGDAAGDSVSVFTVSLNTAGCFTGVAGGSSLTSTSSLVTLGSSFGFCSAHKTITFQFLDTFSYLYFLPGLHVRGTSCYHIFNRDPTLPLFVTSTCHCLAQMLKAPVIA